MQPTSSRLTTVAAEATEGTVLMRSRRSRKFYQANSDMKSFLTLQRLVDSKLQSSKTVQVTVSLFTLKQAAENTSVKTIQLSLNSSSNLSSDKYTEEQKVNSKADNRN